MAGLRVHARALAAPRPSGAAACRPVATAVTVPIRDRLAVAVDHTRTLRRTGGRIGAPDGARAIMVRYLLPTALCRRLGSQHERQREYEGDGHRHFCQ